MGPSLRRRRARRAAALAGGLLVAGLVAAACGGAAPSATSKPLTTPPSASKPSTAPSKGNAPALTTLPPAPPSSAAPTTTSPTPTTSTTVAPTTTSAPPPSSSTTTAVPEAPVALTFIQAPGRPYQLDVPEGWQYTNATYPSDHTTDVWSDPGDPAQTLTVVRSGCTGCVETSINQPTPDPSLVAPSGATSTKTADPFTYDYQAPVQAPGEVDFGAVLIAHAGTVITGYTRLDVVLPSDQGSVAQEIFQSYVD